MLRSIVEDFAAVQGVESVATVVRADLQELIGSAAPNVVIEFSNGPDLDARFERLVAWADATLVIAPESGGVLVRRLQRLENLGAHSLGASVTAAVIAGDKLRLSSLLERRGVPTPEVIPIDPSTPMTRSALDFPAVLKPRDGAGSDWTFRVSGSGDLGRALETLSSCGIQHDMVLSPFVEGTPASVHFVVGDSGSAQLAAGYQLVDDGYKIRYLGGRLPLPLELGERASRLGRQAIACIPGLRGFVGVDVVLGQETADDRVIEVNPRVTTSAVGLRRYHAPWSICAYWLAACKALPNLDFDPNATTIAPSSPNRVVEFSIEEISYRLRSRPTSQ